MGTIYSTALRHKTVGGHCSSSARGARGKLNSHMYQRDSRTSRLFWHLNFQSRFPDCLWSKKSQVGGIRLDGWVHAACDFQTLIRDSWITWKGADLKGVYRRDKPTKNHLQNLQFPSALPGFIASVSSLLWFYHLQFRCSSSSREQLSVKEHVVVEPKPELKRESED